MRVLLIINPTAGGGAVARSDLRTLARHLPSHRVEIAVPASAEDAEAIARQGVAEGYDRILAAGGDGTVRCVVAALAGTDTPLGIIPLGTVNVLAREFGVPLAPERALQVALSGQVRRVDLGEANGRLFTLMAGMGFDAKVVSEIVPRLKELFGPLAYITAGLQELARFKRSIFHIETDDITFSLPAWLVVVGNASYYAYQLPIAQEARMDDGWLDVSMFAEHSAFDRLTQIGAVLVGQHARHPNVRSFRTRRLRITADPPVQLQLDGDPAGTSPVEIAIRPAALSVMVPTTPFGASMT